MTEQESIDVPVEGVEADVVQIAEDRNEIETEREGEDAVERKGPQDESPEEQAPEEETPEEEASELELLQAELEEAQAKADEYLDGWQRARAEFANYRRREEQRRQQLEQAINGRVLLGLLPVVDDMERAFEAVPDDVRESAWVKGLAMVGDKLRSTLEKAGVAAMAVQPGDRFDPNVHQAVFHGPSADFAEGQIVEVYQRGYTLGETVLRPAMVYVSSGAPEEACVDAEPVAAESVPDAPAAGDGSPVEGDNGDSGI